jgi:hypothetical protein
MTLEQYKTLTCSELIYLRDFMVYLSHDTICDNRNITKKSIYSAFYKARLKTESENTLDAAIKLHFFELQYHIGYSKGFLKLDITNNIDRAIVELETNLEELET